MIKKIMTTQNSNWAIKKIKTERQSKIKRHAGGSLQLTRYNKAQYNKNLHPQ
jgi:hypothetical protein